MTSKPLNKMSIKELKALCKEHKIRGHSKCKKKADLIIFIESKLNMNTTQSPIRNPPAVIKEATPTPPPAPLPQTIDTDASGFEDMIPTEPETAQDLITELFGSDDEEEPIEEPIEQPEIIEQPIEQPEIIEEPIEEPIEQPEIIEEPIEEPIEQPEIIEEPIEQPKIIEQPIEEPIEEPKIIEEENILDDLDDLIEDYAEYNRSDNKKKYKRPIKRVVLQDTSIETLEKELARRGYSIVLNQ